MRLILVRHGQTTANVDGLMDTDPPGAPLTELGREQADELVDALRAESIGALFASPAIRTRNTVAPLAGNRGLGVTVLPGLREIKAGSWEMSADNEHVHGYLVVVGRWMSGELDVRTPGATGESGHEVLARYDDAIAQVAAAGADTAVVLSHGAVIRFWSSARSANLADDFGARRPLGNTGMVVLDGDPTTGWGCLAWTGAIDEPAARGPAGDDSPAAEPVPVPPEHS